MFRLEHIHRALQKSVALSYVPSAKPQTAVGVHYLVVQKANFRDLLNAHFYQGTSPTGRPDTASGRWANDHLAEKLNVHASTINNWRNGHTFPTPDNFLRALLLLFGWPVNNNTAVHQLVDAYNLEGPYHLDLDTVDALDDIDETAIQQIPAAFRFGIQNGKIDVLPERPQTVDGPAAKDLYDELQEKLRSLVDRLQRSNIDPHARFSAERLFQGLGTSFEDVRPGVVLSRMRSMEAIRDAFSNEDGSEALFPNAIAMIDDVCLSGQDFLATFPVIRQIERQRLALGIERTPESIKNIQIETEAVQRAAAMSEIVAAGAVNALKENEPDIKQASSVELAADLIADKLLVIRNFISESIRFVTQIGTATAADAWDVIKPDFQEGARRAARILPTLAVIALIISIAGPIAGLAGLLRGDIFKSMKSAVSKVSRVKDGDRKQT